MSGRNKCNKWVQRNVLSIKVSTHVGTSPSNNKSQGVVASCELAIFATKSSRRDQIDFEAKMASSHDATGTCE